VDGEPVGSSPFRERLLLAGFTAGYRGLVLRRTDARTAEPRRPVAASSGSYGPN
jgi:hypothetical protein